MLGLQIQFRDDTVSFEIGFAETFSSS